MRLFGVHPQTVKKWADKGQLVGFRTPGGHWRFRREDIDQALNAERRNPGGCRVSTWDRLAPLVAGLIVTALVVAFVAHVLVATLARGLPIPPP